FYRAALNLVLAVSSLFGFGTVLLPVFTGITKERLERGFQKTVRYIIMFTIPAVVGIVIVARYFILAVYGQEYLPASIPLYALSLIVFISPLISVYSTVFQSKEKAKDLSKIVAYSLVLNILLNLVLIKYFPIWFNKGPEFAILGAAVATVLSRCFYLLALFQISKKSFKIKTKFPDLEKFLLSSLVMAGFLVFFKNFVDINWVFGVIEILAGIVIYFITLYLLKGLKKEDIVLFKNVFYGKFKRIIETKRI
ncbi:MAG: polysaccharide biosynthesis C-terminal domain-containing protein, partial [Minisyncoccales bacterium]